MTNFVDQLKLAERAKEDVYFARIDRELIDALHQREQLDRPRPTTEQSASHSVGHYRTDCCQRNLTRG